MLDRALPGRSFKIIAKKLAVDQMIFSPVCVCVFLLTVNVSKECMYATKWASHNHYLKKKESLSDSQTSIISELKHKGTLLYLSEWIVWPPAQLVNFYFLPTRFRVLYDNTISLLYDIYSSHICNDMEVKDIQELVTQAKSLMKCGADSTESNFEVTSQHSNISHIGNSLSYNNSSFPIIQKESR